MGQDILIKFPTRGRPDRFRRAFALWWRPQVRFVISLDEDDTECMAPAFLAWIQAQPNTRVCVGRSANKIDAMNRDLEGERFDLLILASDDFLPTRPDYPERVVNLMARYFPTGDGLLHLPDGRRRDLITLPILGWLYYQRFGYIYHPDYASVFCDNEQMEVALSLGCYRYHEENIFKHDWSGNAPDATYLRNQEQGRDDHFIYAARKAAGFPRSSHEKK